MDVTLQAPIVDALWSPHPENRPQRAAYICPADELLYGGAAGGGKTDLLLGLAVTMHQQSIIFRRQYPQLEALIQRSMEIIPTERDGANFNRSKNIWYKIPGRRKLEFGAVQYAKDREKFQGRPHDLICFDELTHFEREQYTYLIGWLRTADPAQRTRIVSASNPAPTAEGLWVKERWAPWLDSTHSDPAEPGELRWFITQADGNEVQVDGPRVNTFDLLDGNIEYLEAFQRPDPVVEDGVPIYPMSRTFIPARVRDNPYYSQDPRYLAQLQALPEPLRSQLLEGDWDAGQEDGADQVIPSAWVFAAHERWQQRGQANDVGRLVAIGVDVGRGGDATVLAPLHERNYVAELVKRPGKLTPDGQSVVRMLIPFKPDGVQVNIDVIGIGSSVYDQAKQTLTSANIRGVNFGQPIKTTDKSGLIQMRNVRAEAYWNIRELLDPDNDPELALPPDPELTADLTAQTYRIVAGKLVLDEKEKVKGRIGRSPDCGDAVALALYKLGTVDMLDYVMQRRRG